MDVGIWWRLPRNGSVGGPGGKRDFERILGTRSTAATSSSNIAAIGTVNKVILAMGSSLWYVCMILFDYCFLHVAEFMLKCECAGVKMKNQIGRAHV